MYLKSESEWEKYIVDTQLGIPPPKKSRRQVFTWSLDDVWSQEFGPFLLTALLCYITCKRPEKKSDLQTRHNKAKSKD